MTGLNNIREAYEQVYAQMDERMDPEERALRRAEIADKKASRMDAKVGAKYAGSEAKSAEREDKKSRGKHIHGMADSYDFDGDLVDEELDPTEKREKERLVKGLKKSASDFKKRYGERWKRVMYATATKQAKDSMDTSKSDRRYGVEK